MDRPLTAERVVPTLLLLVVRTRHHHHRAPTWAEMHAATGLSARQPIHRRLLSAPPVVDAWSAWLEDRAAGDAPPTHTGEVTLTFSVDLAAPPWVNAGDALRRAVRRFDPSVLLALVDYDADQLLPGDALLVAAVATVRPA